MEISADLLGKGEWTACWDYLIVVVFIYLRLLLLGMHEAVELANVPIPSFKKCQHVLLPTSKGIAALKGCFQTS